MRINQATDVAIIGGGVEGCSIAYYLSKAGIRVSVIEREEIASEASSAAAGLLAPAGVLTGPKAGADLFFPIPFSAKRNSAEHYFSAAWSSRPGDAADNRTPLCRAARHKFTSKPDGTDFKQSDRSYMEAGTCSNLRANSFPGTNGNGRSGQS